MARSESSRDIAASKRGDSSRLGFLRAPDSSIARLPFLAQALGNIVTLYLSERPAHVVQRLPVGTLP